jgi:hypothetical protein
MSRILRSTDVRTALAYRRNGLPMRRRQRGFIINPFRYGAGDPLFGSVSLLLHFDGANNATTTTDSSSIGHAITFSGNAKLSTASPKWGSACLDLDGSGDYVSALNNSSFIWGTEDYCVEGWINPRTVSGIDTIICNRSSSGNDYNWLVRLDAGVLRCVTWGPTAGTVLVDLNAGSVSTSAWSHIAFCRSGSNFYSFLNGVQQATASSASAVANTISAPASLLAIGLDPSTAGREFDGLIDDIRITKGAARYTAGFTPPTAAFPNFG